MKDRYITATDPELETPIKIAAAKAGKNIQKWISNIIREKLKELAAAERERGRK